MRNRKFARPLLIALALVLSLGAATAVLADTIRLKDGSVIRGQVVGFQDQQFIVLIGTGSRGRRSRILLYMEDVESIEFDSAGAATTGAGSSSADSGMDSAASAPQPAPSRPAPTLGGGSTGSSGGGSQPSRQP
jgi:hypothetical protein